MNGPEGFSQAVNDEYEKKALEIYIRSFFQTRGISENQENRLAPIYTKSLAKYDREIMSQVLDFMADMWCDQHNKIPSVADIVDQYHRLKARAIRLRQKQERQVNKQATQKVNGFWEAFNRCKDAGINDIAVIAKHLQDGVGS